MHLQSFVLRTILVCSLSLVSAVSLRGESVPFDYHSIFGRPGGTKASNLLEGESDFELKGKSRFQGMQNFGPHWSGNAHLLWNGLVGEKMETAFEVSKDGEYGISLILTMAPDYGVFLVRLNDQIVAEKVDLYSTRVELAKPLNLGTFNLNKGIQTMSFELSGGNPKARKFRGNGYLMGMDYLELDATEKAKPENRGTGKDNVLTKTSSFEEVLPLLSKHCFECHGNKEKVKGKTNLKTLISREHYLKSPELTRKAFDSVALHEMPPEDEEQPDDESRRKIASFLESVVDQYANENVSLQPVVMRRMNRYEYNNAVRDLLELRGDVFLCPKE